MSKHKRDLWLSNKCLHICVYRTVDAAAISSNYEWVSRRPIHLLLTHQGTQTAEDKRRENENEEAALLVRLTHKLHRLRNFQLKCGRLWLQGRVGHQLISGSSISGSFQSTN